LILRQISRAVFLSSLLAAIASPKILCSDGKLRALDRSPRSINNERSSAASQAIEVVRQYVEAGVSQDARDRSKYLAEKVLYFGQELTRQQAEKRIISLYRRWPTRKYGDLEDAEIFAIPKKGNVFKVKCSYAYDLTNLNERLRGKSKLTCVLEQIGGRTRIIGLDEKLMSDTTEYSPG
jgi:hypothetical protein